MWNPKVKDFLDEDENKTLISFAWSCWWRVAVIVYGICLVLGLIIEL